MTKAKRWLVGIGLAAVLMTFGAYKAKAQMQSGGPNFMQQLYAQVVGVPQVVLNSGSATNYGYVGNPSTNSSTQWYLGFGTTAPEVFTSVVVTQVLNWTTSAQVVVNAASDAILSQSVFQINTVAANNSEYYLTYLSNGWLEFHAQQASIAGTVAASIPTVTGCGTNASAVTGTDQAGDVSLGTSPTVSCDVFFASKPDNIPHCFCNDSTTKTAGCVVNAVGQSSFIMSPFLNFGNGTDAFLAADRLDWVCLANQ